MREPKTIYCPRCGRKIMSYDGKTHMNLSKKCNKCNKLVVYNTEKDEITLKKVPGRDQASGMRFY